MSDPTAQIEELESVVIRFAGDSGDGMQLTGTQFTNTSAVFGNDISTFPDYPAEIRAPAGTLAGVSGFQVNLSQHDILTPGDSPYVLVAMNPAALKASLPDLERGGIIIVNTDAFTLTNLKKAGYEANPLENDTLSGYEVHEVPLTTLTRETLKDFNELTTKDKDRCQNFFALGMTFWIFDRGLSTSAAWLDQKFAKKPIIAEANKKALETGYYFGETTEVFRRRFSIRPAALRKGTYRKITGNEALALGLVTGAKKMGKPLFYGSYPITPASDILHALAPLRHFDVRTFQAEDEIAAMGSVIGAAFGGALAVTGTSGPGVALKGEAMGLAMMIELPMVIINVQRGGPSTGLPTKVEQSDLLQMFFGRNGESPIPILAPQSPTDAFAIAYEACRLAVHAMTPVAILSDGYLANSSEPWRIPDPEEIAEIPVNHPTGRENDDVPFFPYKRHDDSLARPWAIPGTKGLEHRVGGLAKAPLTGNVSYEPKHHEQMVEDRAKKVARLANVIPELEVDGPKEGDLLVVSWGGTYGAVHTAVHKAQARGYDVAHTHIRYLNPFPKNTEEVLRGYKRILIPELNMGQLAFILRGTYALDNIVTYPKMHGRPFKISEIYDKVEELLGE
ncbi:MAG: 2-oxoglutarate ferredoxin oxidoreductase subunit alpha [Chloroflexi bacterium]|nr:MAG: 2-oxoglutarate ferredoxin oxidoreductase subunit alpha [Chloroflexota bacterium]